MTTYDDRPAFAVRSEVGGGGWGHSLLNATMAIVAVIAKHTMSAFICDERTFSSIYTGMEVYRTSGVLEYSPIRYHIQNSLGQYGTLEKIIEQLCALNVRTVNQKYREKTEERMPYSLVDTEWKASPSLFQFLKSLQCLRYQMREGNVPQEKLYRQLYKLIAAVSLSIVYLDRRYDDARWG